MSKVTVVVAEPRKTPEVCEIENDLKTLQGIVGGYIEIVDSPIPNVQIIVNEEGKFRSDLEINFSYGGDYIVGTAIFGTHDDEGELISLNDQQIEKILLLYDNH